MMGLKFVVKMNSGDFCVWSVFSTRDDHRNTMHWLMRAGLTNVEQISEEEAWKIEELCNKRNATFMGYAT